jgi:hypothetical protein
MVTISATAAAFGANETSLSGEETGTRRNGKGNSGHPIARPSRQTQSSEVIVRITRNETLVNCNDTSYNYDLDSSSSLSYFNMEQQAQIIQDYYRVLKGLPPEPHYNVGTRKSLSDYSPMWTSSNQRDHFRRPARQARPLTRLESAYRAMPGDETRRKGARLRCWREAAWLLEQ